jgi:hypothetical protein
MLMFLLALLYDLQAPQNDGSCVNFINEPSCTDRKSLLDPTQSYCTWDIETQSCIYIAPKITVKIGLYCAILVALVSGLAMVPLDLLFRILYAPSEERLRAKLAAASLSSLNDIGTAGGMRTRDKKVAVAVQPKSELLLKVEEEYRKQRGKMILVVKKIPEQTQHAYVKAKSFVHEVLHEHELDSEIRHDERVCSSGLLNEFKLQRQKLLSQEDIHEFEAAWGLDGLLSSNQTEHLKNKIMLNAKLDIIAHEIQSVEKESTYRIHKLAECSDEQKGVELMQLFVLDLLGRDTIAARILRAKMEEDFTDMPVVSRTVKILAVFVVVCLNLFFAYFVMLRGVEQGIEWQRAYVFSVIVQWLVEALLFETIECLYVNCVMPSFASRDVQRVYETLNEAILHLAQSLSVHHQRAGEEQQHDTYRNCVLNAPQYLFVSTNVAKAFPKLMESMLISAYKTYLPGHVASKWKRHDHGDDVKRIRISRGQSMLNVGWKELVWVASALSFIVRILFINTLAYTPLELQRFILRVMQPFIASGMLFACWYILADYLLLFVCVVGLLVILACLLYQHHLFLKYRRNQLRSITPWVDEVLFKHEIANINAHNANTQDDVHYDQLQSQVEEGKLSRKIEEISTAMQSDADRDCSSDASGDAYNDDFSDESCSFSSVSSGISDDSY